MVELVQFPRRLAISETPQSSVSRTDVESPYKSLGTALDKLGEGLSEVAVPLAEEAGYKAVTRDKDGNIQVDRMPIWGKAGYAYSRAVKVAAVAQGEDVVKKDLLDMRQEFRNDPEGYRVASEKYSEAKVKQYSAAAGDEVGISLGRIISNTSTEVYRGLLNEKENLDLRRATVAIDAQIATAENELEALARGGDTTSKEFRERWEKVAALRREKAANPRLAYPPEMVEYDTRQLDGKVKAAAVLNHVDQVYRKQGFEAAVKEAERIRSDPSIGLTSEQRQTYFNRALTEIRLRRQEERIAEKQDEIDLKEVSRLAVEGYPPTPDRMAELKRRADENPAFAEQYRSTENLLNWVNIQRKRSPADLEIELSLIDKEMREKGASPELRDKYVAGATLLKNMKKDLQADPLGWANRSGVTPIAPLDFNAPNIGAQMRDRVAKAESVAEFYGYSPVYFTPGEKAALEVAASAGGGDMLKVAKLITEGFGTRAPRALAEISQNAPVLAHLGGLMTVGGSQQVIIDAATAVRLRQDKDFKEPKFDRPKALVAQGNLAREQYGDAFVLANDTMKAAEAVARDAYTTRSLRGAGKIDPEVANSDSANAYRKTLQEAAGAKFDKDGVQYGGVTSYGSRWFPGPNRGHVIVPGSVRTDRFRDVILSIQDKDLASQPFKARDVHNAIPVATAGGYRFALGEPGSENPKWLPGKDGQPFVLDYAAIEPVLRQRTPTAFFGGR